MRKPGWGTATVHHESSQDAAGSDDGEAGDEENNIDVESEPLIGTSSHNIESLAQNWRQNRFLQGMLLGGCFIFTCVFLTYSLNVSVHNALKALGSGLTLKQQHHPDHQKGLHDMVLPKAPCYSPASSGKS